MNATHINPLDERIEELERAAWFARIAFSELDGWRGPEPLPPNPQPAELVLNS